MNPGGEVVPGVAAAVAIRKSAIKVEQRIAIFLKKGEASSIVEQTS